jgi:hypothetical protein
MKDFFFFINISKFAALLNEDKFDLIATSKKKAKTVPIPLACCAYHTS